MKGKLTLTANPTTGELFTKNDNPGKDGKDYGFVRVEQIEVDFSNPVATPKVLSALKSFSQEGWDKVKSMFSPGQEMPGKIRVLECLNTHPEFQKVEGKGFTEKRAGNDPNAPFCKIGNKTIFRRTEYIEKPIAGLEEHEDSLLQHDNSDEIKAFQAKIASATAINK